MELIDQLCDHILRIQYNNLPLDVVEGTKKNIIDTIGTIVAGSNNFDCLNLKKILTKYDKNTESSILVHGEKMSSVGASIVNASMGRVCDLDDVHEKAVSHIGVSLIPVALAVGEKQRIDGKSLLTAIALGYDFTSRFCLAAQIPPGVSGFNIGYHSALIGGAAIACKLKGHDFNTIKNALGIAYSMVAGTDQGLLEGSIMVSLLQGITSGASIFAVMLAEEGLKGPVDIFEGKFGYFNTYQRGRYDLQPLISDLGRRYEGLNVSIKLYPCCRFTHSAIEGLMKLLRDHSLNGGEIKKVTIHLSEQAFTYACYPLEKKFQPKNVVEAKFSLPYVIGVILSKGEINLKDFTLEAIKNQDYLQEAQKVEPVIDQEINNLSLNTIGPSRVEVMTKDGHTYETCVHHVKGSPENPLTLEESINKLATCLDSSPRIYNEKTRQKLFSDLLQLEKVKDINEIINMLNMEGSIE